MDSSQLAILAGVVALATGLTKIVEKLVTRIANGKSDGSRGDILQFMVEHNAKEERFQERVTERLEQLALTQEKIAMIVDRMERRDEITARSRMITPAARSED